MRLPRPAALMVTCVQPAVVMAIETGLLRVLKSSGFFQILSSGKFPGETSCYSLLYYIVTVCLIFILNRFIFGKIASCAYVNHSCADMLIIVWFFVTLMVFKKRKCSP